MEIPFYYSFKDFKTNYNFDYIDFKNKFQNFEHYLTEIGIKTNEEIERLSNSNNELTEKEIEKFEKLNDIENIVHEKILSFLLENESPLFPDFKKGDSKEIYILKLKLGFNDYYNKLLQNDSNPNEEKKRLINRFWNRFLTDEVLLELKKIRKFIVNKLAEIENFKEIENDKIQVSETPENDYSGKNELKAKEKLIILDKLGIIDLIRCKMKQPDNAIHLAEIVGAITGIDNTKGTLTGYCNYLIRPDDNNKNSPYNSEQTKNKAMQIFNTFKLNAND